MNPSPKPNPTSKSLYQAPLPLGNREYTFEFRESARGTRFLSVTDQHERNGKLTRDSILVFDDQLDEFVEGLNLAIKAARKGK